MPSPESNGYEALSPANITAPGDMGSQEAFDAYMRRFKADVAHGEERRIRFAMVHFIEAVEPSPQPDDIRGTTQKHGAA